MIVDGYQTLEDRDNASEVEANGPYPCPHNQSWLGEGCYLWDTKIQWAHDWGATAYGSKGKNYLILHCKVDLSNGCFDLVGCVEHQVAFIETVKAIQKDKKARGWRVIVSDIIQFMKKRGTFPYKSIRASDDQPKESVMIPFRKRGIEQMILNQRVQICVITKKDVVLPPIKVVFPVNRKRNRNT